MTTVVYLENVLSPGLRRVERSYGQSLAQLDPKWQIPYVAFVDGKPVLRADWELVVEENQSVAFLDVRALPQGGGGGGGGGSDPLRVMLTLAVLIYAPYLAGEFVVGGGLGLAEVGLTMSAATSMVAMAGVALVNAILPPPKAATSAQQTAALASPSPTYSLQAQGNVARLDAAIPEHFGRHVAYPDFAAQPYTEYAGNEQYLYQLLCVGRGYYDFESVRVEDTVIFNGNTFVPTGNFEDITVQKVEPGESPSLFPANVLSSVEVSGQGLSCWSATYAQSGTVLTVTLPGHGKAPGALIHLNITSGGATSGSYTIATAPTSDTLTVVAPSYTGSGNVIIGDWLGAFVANPGNTAANFLGFDWVLPRGIYYVNSTTGAISNVSISLTVDYRQIDNSGVPVAGVAGTWATLFAKTYTGGTTTPQRYSDRYPVNPGRYEVRVRRTNPEQTGSSYGHNLVWGGLRAYLPEVALFGDVTLLAVRMKASNNLSSLASRKMNVIVTRKLPIWNGSTWSANTATRSPSWAVAYACKQIGMTDAQLDLAALLQLNNTCAARGDFFDARFDNFVSFWEVITKMLGAVRAKPFMQGGVLRLIRDQASTIPVAMFSVRNIVTGSFSINYLMPTPETADAVDVKYFDANRWAAATVRAKLPTSIAATPAKIELFGVTGRDQAFREGMYQAASNRYRRKLITFKTEMEGFIPSFGDLIIIQHDMPAWGQGGDVIGYAESVTNYALVSEDFSNAAWSKESTSTITTDVLELAPNGTQTADKIVEAATALGHYAYQSVSRAAGAHTVSVFVKKAERQWAAIQIATDTRSKRFTVLVDLDTGLAVSTNSTGSPVIPSYVINNAGDGWYRVELTATHAAGTVDLIVGISNSATPSWASYVLPQYTGDTSKGLYAWGAMVHPGSSALPYVRTTGAAATASVLTLSEPPQWGSGTHYLGLRKRDGSVDGPFAVTIGGLPNQVLSSVTPTVAPYTGSAEERTHYAFGWSETWRQSARVLSVKPDSLTTSTILAVNEDSNVHTAEVGQTTPTQVTSQLAGYTNMPMVLGLIVRSMPNDATKMLLTWTPRPWADHYLIEQSNDGTSWTRTGESSTANYTATALYGNATILRVAAVGIARGPWVQVLYGGSADYMWAADDSTMMWDAVDTNLMWRY